MAFPSGTSRDTPTRSQEAAATPRQDPRDPRPSEQIDGTPGALAPGCGPSVVPAGQERPSVSPGRNGRNRFVACRRLSGRRPPRHLRLDPRRQPRQPHVRPPSDLHAHVPSAPARYVCECEAGGIPLAVLVRPPFHDLVEKEHDPMAARGSPEAAFVVSGSRSSAPRGPDRTSRSSDPMRRPLAEAEGRPSSSDGEGGSPLQPPSAPRASGVCRPVAPTQGNGADQYGFIRRTQSCFSSSVSRPRCLQSNVILS